MTQQARLLPFAFTAVGSGRNIALDKLGRPTAMLCFGQNTAGAVDPVVEAIRARYPEEQVLIVSVVDLKKLPKLLNKIAEMTMNGRYNDEAKKLREGLDPAEHVVILPDWDGNVSAELGLGDVDARLALVVLASDGTVAGVYQDEAPETVVAGMLEPLVSS